MTARQRSPSRVEIYVETRCFLIACLGAVPDHPAVLQSSVSRFEVEMPQPRTHPRSKIHEKCIVVRANGSEFGSCVITDISKGGAKLRFSTQDQIPDTFVLVLSRNKLVRRRCKVVWRSDTPAGRSEKVLGVSFLDPPSSGTQGSVA
jgi:hypothetical protein